jgi:muconolactone delta-isomerase
VFWGLKRFMEVRAVDVRVPTESEILENPRRRDFIGGGWVDSSDLSMINVYWHKRQGLFTVYSLLNVLEHETLHSVLARLVSLKTSMKLDRIHRSSHVWMSEDKLVYINEFWFKKWTVPPYFEEPNENMLE